MQRILSLLLFSLFFQPFLFSQSNDVILFTEEKEKFHVVLNGILQNPTPVTNVKIMQLPAPSYRCRIIFTNTELGYFDFTLNFPYVDEEITMAIKKDKKGEYISKLFDSKPISPNNEKTPNQVQIVFSTTPVASKTLSTSTNQTTTTRTSEVTTGEGTINSQNVDTVSASGTDVGIKDRETTGTNLTFVSTTSTTTTLTTTNASKTIEPDGKVYVEGYTGTIGCPKPMTDENFNLMKLNISENNLEATKLSIAKQVLQENCLLAGQVRELLSLFEFENTKLDFAKFAYTYTYDPGNYYKVNEAFEFESSVDDLNKHINPK